MSLRILSLLFCAVLLMAASYDDADLQEHVNDLKTFGSEPVAFVKEILGNNNLIVFDDAYHHTHESWIFYGDLIKDRIIAQEIDYVFVELMTRDQNDAVEAYLTAEDDDQRLLIPAFTNGLHGTGQRFGNIWNFLGTVRKVNQDLPDNQKIKVIGVAPSTNWKGLRSHEEWQNWYNLYVDVYDYSMFKIIDREMDSFNSGKKAFFLTNTRHAYKNIRSRDGDLYWNVTTFLNSFHPGDIYSIRIHNSILEFSLDESGEVTMGFTRIAKGLWDSAFAANGNVPVAVPFRGTIFGEAPYLGNSMLNILKGSTMKDANDATVFLAPIEELHICEYVDIPYTEEFKKEMERRLPIRYGDDLKGMIENEGVKTVREYIDKIYVASDITLLPLSQEETVGPVDAWKQ